MWPLCSPVSGSPINWGAPSQSDAPPAASLTADKLHSGGNVPSTTCCEPCQLQDLQQGEHYFPLPTHLLLPPSRKLQGTGFGEGGMDGNDASAASIAGCRAHSCRPHCWPWDSPCTGSKVQWDLMCDCINFALDLIVPLSVCVEGSLLKQSDPFSIGKVVVIYLPVQYKN